MSKILDKKIAQYNRDLTKINSEKTRINDELSQLNVKASELKLLRDKAIAEIQQANVKVTVSDHAIIRYIERVMALDIESIRKRILTDTVCQAVKLGAKSVKTADATFVVSGNVIVTVVV